MPSVVVPRRLLRLSLFLLGCVFVAIILIKRNGGLSSDSQKYNVASGTTPELASLNLIPAFCNDLDIRNIAFVTKTGATEAMHKLPPQLTTCLRCVSDPLILSDLDQSIGPYPIHDVLAQFSEEAMTGNKDFDIYHKQKLLASQGRQKEIEKLGELPILTYDWRARGRNAAWALDKYKFLHMIDQAFQVRPNKDWYVFVEADTYVSLSNLVQFLSTKKSTDKLYFGNGVRMFEHPTELYFAHGGSGFILSHATVKDFTKKYNSLAKLEWDMRTKYEWFGDFLVADALDEISNVKLTDILPMMQGDNPFEFPFGEHSWCIPAITLHHMSAEDFQKVFDHERSQNFTGTLFRDLFTLYFPTPFPLRKDNWKNSADNGKFRVELTPNDVEHLPEGLDPQEMMYPDNSFEACRLGCIQHRSCLQFSFHSQEDGSQTCHLSSVVIFGHAYEADELEQTKSVVSGWLSDRISDWVQEHQECYE